MNREVYSLRAYVNKDCKGVIPPVGGKTITITITYVPNPFFFFFYT